LDWKITNVLPKIGGTLDQDPEFMRDLRIIAGIENSFEKMAYQKRELEQKIKSGKTSPGRK
jgi:hypothetical protein